jgi:etoposide-induced 2.4 mRNA
MEVVRHPSPFVPLRLPVFRPVILINDLIVRVLSVGAGGKRTITPLSPGGSSSKSGKKAGGYGFADGFDNIEEGGEVETVELHAGSTGRPMPVPTPLAAGRRRVNIRRKVLD